MRYQTMYSEPDNESQNLDAGKMGCLLTLMYPSKIPFQTRVKWSIGNMSIGLVRVSRIFLLKPE